MRILNRNLIIAALLLATSSLPAQAQQSVFTYTRENVKIVRNQLKLDPSLMPWQQKEAIENNKLPIAVELRDGRLLYQQEGWFNLSNYDDNSGLLLMFDQPGEHPLMRMTNYAPMDILFINEQGRIIQIMPNLQLSELEQEVMPESPVSAMLFLKAGTCEKRVISPGDTIEYGAFRRSPLVLKDAPRRGAPVILKEPAAPAHSDGPLSDEQQKLQKLYGAPAGN